MLNKYDYEYDYEPVTSWLDLFMLLNNVYVLAIEGEYYYERHRNALYSNEFDIFDFYIDNIETLISSGNDPSEGLDLLLHDSLLYNIYNKLLFGQSTYQTYGDIMNNYILLNKKLDRIFNIFISNNALLDTNFIYDLLPDINNDDLYMANDINDIFYCKEIGLVIDILGTYYFDEIKNLIEELGFDDIQAIPFNISDPDNINQSYSKLFKSNLKFYSKFIQNITNDITIVGGRIPFENWDSLYYMFNYKTNVVYNYIFFRKTHEIQEGFHSTIEYLLKNGFNAQEGFDKYIETLSNQYSDVELINLQETKRIHTKVIGLFKNYVNKVNISPIFTKIFDQFNDDDIIDENSDINPLIDDISVGNISAYHHRGILLDSIANNYIVSLTTWQMVKSKVFTKFDYNVINKVKKYTDWTSLPNDMIDKIDRIYGYNLIYEVNKYTDWSSLPALQNPIILINNIYTYKDLRYMMLKYYSNFLQSL